MRPAILPEDTPEKVLWQQAVRFCGHSGIAIGVLASVVVSFSLCGASVDARWPKVVCTGLAFVLPLLAGLAGTLIRQDHVAPYTWVAGLLVLSLAALRVLDLPPDYGLCDGCQSVERLWRTFFSIEGNTGLLEGNGVLIGTWLPLSTFGYAIGARLGRRESS